MTAANSVTYGYDTVGRLAQSVTSGGTTKRQDFGFDLNGNRTRIDYRTNATDANPVSSQTYALTSGTNRLALVSDNTGTRSISYDARGNTTGETRPASVTVTAGYDGYGRLTSYRNSSASALVHTYNGLDDRVSTATTTGSTTDTRRFVYDADGRLLGEYGTSATNVKAETIWLSPDVGGSGRPFGGDDGVDGYAPLAEVVGTTLYWVHGNHLGVPVVTTTSAAATASPTGFTRVGFPGQTQTTSDLYYNRYRDYDPNLGRYIHADPIGLGGGNNPYSYAANDPVRFTDLTGLSPAGPVKVLHLPVSECGREKDECIKIYSELTLPTRDHGASFYRRLSTAYGKATLPSGGHTVRVTRLIQSIGYYQGVIYRGGL